MPRKLRRRVVSGLKLKRLRIRASLTPAALGRALYDVGESKGIVQGTYIRAYERLSGGTRSKVPGGNRLGAMAAIFADKIGEPVSVDDFYALL